jgi:FkbM family methyltransferase
MKNWQVSLETVRVIIVKCLKLIRLYRPTVFVLTHKPIALITLRIDEMQWRRRAKVLYSQFIRPGDLAFDVGANRGTRTEIFRKLGATVVAIEPQEYCMNTLRKRFKDKVFFEQVALGDAESYAEMMINDDADVTSTLSKGFIEATVKSGTAGFCRSSWNRTITVAVKTLDSLISKYGCPSFCKIDVEGFKYEVLMGLSRSIAALSIEFHSAYFEPFVGCIKRLSSLGFMEYNYSMGETMRLALPKWVASEEIIDIVAAMPRQMVYGDIYAKRAAPLTRDGE